MITFLAALDKHQMNFIHLHSILISELADGEITPRHGLAFVSLCHNVAQSSRQVLETVTIKKHDAQL